MMRGMARAARVFGEPAWLASARRALDFIRATLWRGRHALAAPTCKDGVAHLNAYLDDHAFLLDALLELMQCEFREEDLRFARELAELLLEQLRGPRGGRLLLRLPRPREAHPPRQARPRQRHALRQRHRRVRAAAPGAPHRRAALPRCGGARVEALLPRARAPAERLREPRHRARRISLAAADRHPARRRADVAAEWQRALARRYRPDTLVIALPAGRSRDCRAVLDKPAPAGGVNAWVCRGVTCLPPISDLAELERVLSAGTRPGVAVDRAGPFTGT